MLVVEDVHWADDATLDVLGYVGAPDRGRSALLVLTVPRRRVDPRHPLHRLLGALAGARCTGSSSRRSRATRCRRWPSGTGRDPAAVHALTRGNPFFVTEALAAPPDEVPASVKDAVLARVRRLAPDCREALERLSVVPVDVAARAGDGLLGERSTRSAGGRARRA